MTRHYRIKIKIAEDRGESATVRIVWTKGISETALAAALTGLKDMAAQWYADRHGDDVGSAYKT